MNILVIKFRNIGDVLLSTALIRELNLLYPNANIDYVLNEESAPMLSQNPRIRKLFCYKRKLTKKQNIFSRINYEYTFLRSIISEKYDIVINLTEGDRGAIISKLSKAREKIGFRSKNRWVNTLLKPYTNTLDLRFDIHTVEKDLTVLNALGHFAKSKKVELFLNENSSNDKYIAAVPDDCKYIIVHPVSRWMFKCWDEKKFAAVIDHIQKIWNIPVVITASPEPRELEYVQEIINHCMTKPINFSGKLNLNDLAFILSKAYLFLGVDTAPMHMAAALNIPVIALFGSSDCFVWGPWDNSLNKSNYKKKCITQYNGIHTIIQHCGDEIYYENNQKRSRAMMAIEVDEVINELKIKLKNLGAI